MSTMIVPNRLIWVPCLAKEYVRPLSVVHQFTATRASVWESGYIANSCYGFLMRQHLLAQVRMKTGAAQAALKMIDHGRFRSSRSSSVYNPDSG